jgi:tetratricopeptide (TPR) repeat protein
VAAFTESLAGTTRRCAIGRCDQADAEVKHQAYKEIGRVLRDRGEDNDAQVAFTKSLEAQPICTESWDGIVNLLVNSGEKSKVPNLVMSTLKHLREPKVQGMRARALGVAGFYREALSLFDRAIETDSKTSWLFLYRGFTHFRIKKYDVALKDFDVALRMDPNNPRTLAQRADCLRQLERYDEAVED